MIMSKYVDEVLIEGERVVYTGHITLWSLWHLLLFGVLLLPIGIGLILLIIAYVRYKSTELAITNKRVIAKTGFVSRHTIELNINRVESLQVTQSIFGRIFNFGTLIISGGGNPQAPIAGISNPLEFRKAFIEVQDQASAKS
jgi:uncharacterized membrane protein YdbT with pleckstrin-like domain